MRGYFDMKIAIGRSQAQKLSWAILVIQAYKEYHIIKASPITMRMGWAPKTPSGAGNHFSTMLSPPLSNPDSAHDRCEPQRATTTFKTVLTTLSTRNGLWRYGTRGLSIHYSLTPQN